MFLHTDKLTRGSKTLFFLGFTLFASLLSCYLGLRLSLECVVAESTLCLEPLSITVVLGVMIGSVRLLWLYRTLNFAMMMKVIHKTHVFLFPG